MNVFLLYPDRDFNIDKEPSQRKRALIEDLELKPLLSVMADSQDLIYKVVESAIGSPLLEREEILYRQDVFRDVLKNKEVIKELYRLAEKARDAEKKSRFGFFTHHLGGILYSAIELMRMLLDFLKRLREIAIESEGGFSSDGFVRFFKMIEDELTPDYFQLIEKHLKILEFKGGLLISARLGKGNKGVDYTLCDPSLEKRGGFVNRLFGKKEKSYTFSIDERDESGERALSEIRERGINYVTNALAQSVEHILNFFDTLKTELAFYIGLLNLYTYMDNLKMPTCFPSVAPKEEVRYMVSDLYDPSLAITLNKKVVGNSLSTEGRVLFIITGANGGGKSTFLRSVGVAQLMMQAGMFVCARDFSAPIHTGIYTHFRREEDEDMESGKLDEELRRLNEIIDELSPYSLVLFNESFSSTNEKEGAQIAREVVSALVESSVRVFFVTHMYKFASDFYKEKRDDTLFLSAERKEDGKRTYKMIEAPPQRTGYTKDLLKKL